ncbi:HAD family hydrolase [Myceligenerans pegani]|uniref:HAD family phosphatase n=1 Tax=Myceligenerans pegani TaxID=2776917 RepID=A0ABR9N0M7_9MICO|nr:HAD family hydrolase [Myceligenerans sp. TRM 65318]MBE1876623.1 HAD family phosphatase [Myceligenerans sp. TRM 65318]MBE3018894.1 HAD family phosphatase [Myceligenerans sp. TRM 65318]
MSHPAILKPAATAATLNRATIPRLTAARPALLALDVDGTLLVTGQKIPEVTVRAVRAAVAAGHTVVLATGRPLGGVRPVVRQLGLRSGWVTCSNGAVVARITGRRLTVTSRVTFDPTRALLRACGAAPDALLAVGDIQRGGWRVSQKFPRGRLNGPQRRVRWEHDLWDRPTSRAVVAADDAADLAHELSWCGVTATPAGPDWVDLTAKNLSKASGLEQIRLAVGIEKDATIAVGDATNDICAFEWAATAVAMGQAPDEVKAAADFVTGTIHEHGILPVLDALAVTR